MAREMNTQMGRISLSEEVIATIAGVAATECYGVVGMASTRVKDGIAELLGRENLSRGVEVALNDDTVEVTLYIVVGYGTKISEVAHNVVDKVKYTVESTTGLKVNDVRVRVQGVKVNSSR
ncbi:MAG: Asp23/Gls24 family envelope stress response protein [Symbiobacteriia bacterium]